MAKIRQVNEQYLTSSPNPTDPRSRVEGPMAEAYEDILYAYNGLIVYSAADDKYYKVTNAIDGLIEPGGYEEWKQGGDPPDLTAYVKTADLSLTGSGLSYTLKVGSQTIGTISIPKDQFLKSAGYDQSTHILTLVFETTTGEKTETIDLSNLVDTYTKGNGITITNHTIAIDPTVVATKTDINGLNTALSGKQDTITDLSTIRDGASKGATALQEHQSLAGYALKTEIPAVPTNVSSFNNDAGYLTEHQNISDKQDKLTAGNGISISDDNVISSTWRYRTLIKEEIPDDGGLYLDCTTFSEASVILDWRGETDTLDVYCTDEDGNGSLNEMVFYFEGSNALNFIDYNGTIGDFDIRNGYSYMAVVQGGLLIAQPISASADAQANSLNV